MNCDVATATATPQTRISKPNTCVILNMNWTGGRLRRHSQINSKARKQTFGNTSAASKGHGPHQITLFNSFAKQQDAEKRGNLKHSTGNPEVSELEAILSNCTMQDKISNLVYRTGRSNLYLKPRQILARTQLQGHPIV